MGMLAACSNPAKDRSRSISPDLPVGTGAAGISDMETSGTRSDMARKTAILSVVPDSVQILYYDDPDGDSLRYARFYSYTATADTATLGTLMRGLDQPYYESAQRRPCRSEGKIYLFSEAEPLKTVYFSAQNDQGCRYLYVIRDGHFLYFDMTPGLVAVLEQQRRHSVKP